MAQACSASVNLAQENNNSFIISGRGGLPPNPTQPLTGDTIKISKQQKVETPRSEGAEKFILGDRQSISSDEIVPARGMMINERGQVVLTRYPTPNNAYRDPVPSQFCSS